MDTNKLYEILNETTVQLRKGEIYEGTPELVEQAKNGIGEDGLEGGGVLEVFAMPHESEINPDIEKVDLEFLIIGVDKDKAEARKEELIRILDEYPSPEILESGPSYITVGADIGDQGAAFQLFALGKVLGLWDIITPATLGVTGEQAQQMAGSGFIMITGYKSQALR